MLLNLLIKNCIQIIKRTGYVFDPNNKSIIIFLKNLNCYYNLYLKSLNKDYIHKIIFEINNYVNLQKLSDKLLDAKNGNHLKDILINIQNYINGNEQTNICDLVDNIYLVKFILMILKLHPLTGGRFSDHILNCITDVLILCIQCGIDTITPYMILKTALKSIAKTCIDKIDNESIKYFIKRFILFLAINKIKYPFKQSENIFCRILSRLLINILLTNPKVACIVCALYYTYTITVIIKNRISPPSP